MNKAYKQTLTISKDKQKDLEKTLNYLKRKTPKDLDIQMQKAHDKVFKSINCLDCGNCCRTTGPLLLMKDIERIAKSMKMKPQNFMEKYVRIDDDNEFTFNSLPCPFLAEDNYCLIYEDRPKACREFPHTDRKKFYQINTLTKENIKICPAVVSVLDTIGPIYMKENFH